MQPGRWIAALTLSMACATPAASPPAPEPSRPPIELTYLGVAGWQLTDGKVVVLVDPYFSRPVIDDDALMVPDEQAIAARVPARAAVVLVGHSHVDHLLDVPTVARLTGAEIVGTESTARYARASGIPSDKIITVRGGEDYAFDGFSVRVIPSLHSALDDKHTFAADTVIPPDVKLPMKFVEFVEGGTLAYLVRLGGHEVLFLTTANYIERELAGIRPDVAVVATGLRHEIHDYGCRLMGLLGHPTLVLANHFDRWMEPIGQPLPPETLADLERFGEEVRACAPSTRVVVPKHFQKNVVD